MVKPTDKQTENVPNQPAPMVGESPSVESQAGDAGPTAPSPSGVGPQDADRDSSALEHELKRLEEELAVAHDGALRAQAELDNFRKRSCRELEEERKFAGLPLMRDLLPVLDNLQRAIDAAEHSENASGLLEGVKMVAQQLLGVLEQHQCKPIDALGSTFDPNLHEAIGQVHCDTQPAGDIAEVALVGYQLHNRVVRPPQVLVSKGPADDKEDD